MAVRTWPTGSHWLPTPGGLSWGVITPKSGYAHPYTGQRQSVGHLSDRLRCSLTLPACGAEQAQEREAWLLSLHSTDDWVRMPHLHRTEPLGTLRGAPVMASAAAAGARTLSITTTPGATLLAGDIIGAGGQAHMVADAATANGAGAISVSLVIPTPVAIGSGAAVTWQSPTATWQLLDGQGAMLTYGRGRWQLPMELQLIQAV